MTQLRNSLAPKRVGQSGLGSMSSKGGSEKGDPTINHFKVTLKSFKSDNFSG